MGVTYISAAEASAASYQGEAWKIVPLSGPVSESSRTIAPRFITEDVPMGLVAWASMGRKLRVPTPTLDAMIHLAGVAKGTDFWKDGRTVERLGLADKSMSEVLSIVNA
jgi:opine dehydrogenase